MNSKIILSVLIAASLSACSTSGTLFDNRSTPAQIPKLGPELSKRPEPLPVLTDPSLKAQIRDAAATDVKYNDLAYRYDRLLVAWDCLTVSFNPVNKTTFEACVTAKEKALLKGE